jgi:tetratricopeptide (TPR) repeat protein
MKSTAPQLARARRRALGAAALAAIAAATVFLLAVRSDDTASSNLNPDLVAVATLANETGDAALEPLGRMAAERIAQGIQQYGVAEVVPPNVALAAAEEAQQTSDRVKAFAQATGAGVVLHGAYYLLSDSLQLQIQITDADDERILSALAPVAGSRESMTETLDLVRERVLGALAAALDVKSGAAWVPMRPASLEAYRVYQQGGEAEDRGDMDEADRLYREAWAMDSTLYHVLGLIAGIRLMQARWTGDASLQAEADSLFRLYDGYRDRMSEAERLISEAFFAYDEEGPEAHHRVMQRLAELVPAHSVGAVGAAWNVYRPRETLERAARVDAANPRFSHAMVVTGQWGATAEAHHMLDQYEEELEVARAVRREHPDNLVFLDHHLRALAALGRVEELNVLLDTVFALPLQPRGRNVFLPDIRARRAADELRAHGHRDAAREVLQRTIAWIEARPRDEGQQWEWFGSYYRYALAECLYKLERWEEARALYEELLPEGGPRDTLVLAGLGAAAARLGDGERARTIAEQLAGKPGGQLLGRARIAAPLGEREEAVRLLHEALERAGPKGVNRRWGHYILRRHQDMDLESLHGYPPFELFMRPRG